MAAILTNAGRAAIAAAVKDKTLHLAWGTGDEAWDTNPVPEPANATALVAEIGRHALTQALFVVPDPAGDIEVPPGKFTQSPTPTKYLYLRFNFDFTDAPSATIREVAVFAGTTLAVGVPPGKAYLAPEDIDDPGEMVTLERIRVDRSAFIRQRFEIVLQF